MNENILKEELDMPILFFKETDSTNTRARELEAPEALIIADSQTKGRGRMGREYFCPEGGIYMSYTFCEKSDGAPPVQLLTIRAAVCLAEALEEYSPVRAEIKWVNDIYAGGRKVCGILCENIRHRIVVGVGINCFDFEFPPELSKKAGTVKISEKERFSAAFVRKLKEHRQADEILEQYRARMFLTGKSVSFVLNGEKHEGIVSGVDESGALLVDCKEALFSLDSGEVSINIF